MFRDTFPVEQKKKNAPSSTVPLRVKPVSWVQLYLKQDKTSVEAAEGYQDPIVKLQSLRTRLRIELPFQQVKKIQNVSQAHRAMWKPSNAFGALKQAG